MPQFTPNETRTGNEKETFPKKENKELCIDSKKYEPLVTK